MNRFAGSQAFIVAELGINHNGSLKKAMEMAAAAKDAGADAVKLQVFTGEDFYWKSRDFHFGKNRQWKEGVKELFETRRLERDEIKEVYTYCREIGILCFSTPLSFRWLEFLEEVDNPIYKIASGDVTCLPFIEEIARIGKPIILSTGKCTLGEVDAAVQQIQTHTSTRLGLLHCVAAYPTPLENANLRLIQTYEKLYDCVPGFSDHTIGEIAGATAVALGAKIVEKHFTLDKNDYGPDHWFSADKTEMKTLVRSIRSVEAMLGGGRKLLDDIERESYVWGTKSVVANRHKQAGELLRYDDLDYKRPGMGLKPSMAKDLVGKKLKESIAKDQPLFLSAVERIDERSRV